MRPWFALMLLITMLPSRCMGSSPAKTLTLRHGEDIVVSVRFMPNRKLVSASTDGTIVMWDSQAAKRVWEIDLDAAAKTRESHTISNISDMDLSPDGSTLAVAYDRARVVGDQLAGKSEYRIGLLDVHDGREQRAFTGHTALIGTLAFSPDGRLLISASADRTLRLWNIETGKQVWSIDLKETGHVAAFSQDGKHIAIGTQAVNDPKEPVVELRDVQSGRLERKLLQGKRNVGDMAFSPRGFSLAVASDDLSGTQIDLWDLTAKESKRTLNDHEGGITTIAFSSDGRLLASGDLRNRRGHVIVRDLTTNTAPRKHKLPAGVSSLSFSPDGSLLAAGTEKGQIVLIAP